MSDQNKGRGGHRENSGKPTVDSEKRAYSYKLTPTEKEIIDGYRASKGLEK